jgi:hypothetical protein
MQVGQTEFSKNLVRSQESEGGLQGPLKSQDIPNQNLPRHLM